MTTERNTEMHKLQFEVDGNLVYVEIPCDRRVTHRQITKAARDYVRALGTHDGETISAALDHLIAVAS